jgi:hypothetical protein
VPLARRLKLSFNVGVLGLSSSSPEYSGRRDGGDFSEHSRTMPTPKCYPPPSGERAAKINAPKSNNNFKPHQTTSNPIRSIEQSENRTIGKSNNRKIEQSENRTIGKSNNRKIEQSLHSCHDCLIAFYLLVHGHFDLGIQGQEQIDA